MSNEGNTRCRSIAEKISGEMFKPNAAIWDDAQLKEPDEEEIKAVAQVRVNLSKKKGDEEEDEQILGPTGLPAFRESYQRVHEEVQSDIQKEEPRQPLREQRAHPENEERHDPEARHDGRELEIDPRAQ